MNTQNIQSIASLGHGISMIAITGGPCSGKTTGLKTLVAELRARRFKVLVSRESATKLILAGITPVTVGLPEFQRRVLVDTVTREERLLRIATAYRARGLRVVVLCDRGAADGGAYVPAHEFESLVGELGLSLAVICERRYHAVWHLVTAADGAEPHYTLENNGARTETAAEARDLDRRTLAAWGRHPNRRVVDNSTGFDGKIQRLLAEVLAHVGVGGEEPGRTSRQLRPRAMA